LQFKEMKRENDGRSVLLTEQQERWLSTQRAVAALRAIPRYPPPRSAWRARVFDAVNSEWFDPLVISVIVANAALMATYHYRLSSAWDSAISWLNVAFTALYVAEAAAKILAVGGAYFKVGPELLQGCSMRQCLLHGLLARAARVQVGRLQRCGGSSRAGWAAIHGWLGELNYISPPPFPPFPPTRSHPTSPFPRPLSPE
jgi:hypothetical protein